MFESLLKPFVERERSTPDNVVERSDDERVGRVEEFLDVG